MPNKKKTEAEIEAEIAKLKEVRPRVIPRSAFGDDNLAAVDAMITALERRMDDDDVYEYRFDREPERDALDAVQWMQGEYDEESLADGLPLRKE